MTGTRKPRRCRICRKRPAWTYKNCPPGVCKRCYHKSVWPDRPAARKQRQAESDEPDRSWIDEPFDGLSLLTSTQGDVWDLGRSCPRTVRRRLEKGAKE